MIGKRIIFLLTSFALLIIVAGFIVGASISNSELKALQEKSRLPVMQAEQPLPAAPPSAAVSPQAGSEAPAQSLPMGTTSSSSEPESTVNMLVI